MLAYLYFKENYKLIAKDLSKQQQALDADLKSVQWINFKGNLELAGNAVMFSIIKELWNIEGKQVPLKELGR